MTCQAVAPVARATDPLQNGRAFLSSRQLTDPAWMVVDSFEAYLASANPAIRQSLVVSLLLSQAENHEAGVLRAAALATAPYGDLAAAAALRTAIANSELGLSPGARGPDPLVVAAALRFAAADGSEESASTLIGVLRTLQRSDGSFGFADNDGDVAATAEVARVLASAAGSSGADLLAAARGALRAAVANRSVLPAADVALLLLALGPGDEATSELLALELASRQDATGGFDGGDIRATALAIEALSFAMPDLILQPPPVALEAPASGKPYSYSVVVTNAGATSSPPTGVDYTLRDGTGALVMTGSAAVPALGPGQLATVALELGVQGAPGARRLTAIINPTGTFVEGSYDNNVLTVDLRVADKPDLEILASDISVSPSPPMVNGDTRVTVRVRNVGEAVATNVHVQIFQGEPGAGGVLLGEQYFNAVANGTPRVLIWLNPSTGRLRSGPARCSLRARTAKATDEAEL